MRFARDHHRRRDVWLTVVQARMHACMCTDGAGRGRGGSHIISIIGGVVLASKEGRR